MTYLVNRLTWLNQFTWTSNRSSYGQQTPINVWSTCPCSPIYSRPMALQGKWLPWGHVLVSKNIRVTIWMSPYLTYELQTVAHLPDELSPLNFYLLLTWQVLGDFILELSRLPVSTTRVWVANCWLICIIYTSDVSSVRSDECLPPCCRLRNNANQYSTIRAIYQVTRHEVNYE